MLRERRGFDAGKAPTAFAAAENAPAGKESNAKADLLSLPCFKSNLSLVTKVTFLNIPVLEHACGQSSAQLNQGEDFMNLCEKRGFP
jgi:hypothetical protein